MALTPKQAAFVREYLIDLNATAAYKRAGYKAKTNTVARVEGCRLLAKPSVAAAIQAAMAKRAEKTEIKAERVLLEIARLAFSDLRNYTEWGPDGVALKDSAGLTEEQAVAVAEVSETKSESGGSLKFKLHSKPEALRMLAQHLGMLIEKHEHSGEVGVKAKMSVEDAVQADRELEEWRASKQKDNQKT